MRKMKYGICLSTFNEYADPNLLADLEVEIEQSGWDSVFLWDHLIFNVGVRGPIIHPWVVMSAIASKTKRIKIGTYVTPIPRYPPWILAKETAALDILSKGRFLLGAGLGGPAIEYTAFGQQYNTKVLAEKLDESLESIQGLWSGEPFSYTGRHYTIQDACFLPTPNQKPRIPIMIGGMWPNIKPFVRAAHYDGVMPISVKFPEPLLSEDIAEIGALIKEHRTCYGAFEVIYSGTTNADLEKASEQIEPYINAGVTWWLEHINGWLGSLNTMFERIRAGPPKA